MFTWKIASKSSKAWNHDGQAAKVADAVKAMKLMFDECKKKNGDIPNDLDWGVHVKEKPRQ
jgi:hypothetical protein